MSKWLDENFSKIGESVTAPANRAERDAAANRKADEMMTAYRT